MPETFSPAEWRLLLSEALPGARNMALDTAILEAVDQGAAPPTLRLYRWDPPCLSLGYSQDIQDCDLNALDELGWDLVRRPTGGRAILHTDELTYAVIGPRSDPRLAGGLMDSYRRLSRALYLSLASMGLPVEIHSGKNPRANQQPVCFENPSDFEITCSGKKIIGSAQARRKRGLLQHGTLPLRGDLTRITRVLRFPSQAAKQDAAAALLDKAITAEDVLGKEVSWEEAAETFQDSFSRELNLEWRHDPLSKAEQERAAQLESEMFANLEWTHK